MQLAFIQFFFIFFIYFIFKAANPFNTIRVSGGVFIENFRSFLQAIQGC